MFFIVIIIFSYYHCYYRLLSSARAVHWNCWFGIIMSVWPVNISLQQSAKVYLRETFGPPGLNCEDQRNLAS